MNAKHYHPFYCEENAWWLIQDEHLVERDGLVVFVSNPERQCMLYHQNAAPPGEVVFWDYHVFVAARTSTGIGDGERGWEIWDPDTRLGMPVAASIYLEQTFPDVPPSLESIRSVFRVVPGPRFLEVFSTDRSHMRSQDDGWLQPPPPWDPPRAKGCAMNLMPFIDMEGPFEGEVLSLPAIHDRLA